MRFILFALMFGALGASGTEARNTEDAPRPWTASLSSLSLGERLPPARLGHALLRLRKSRPAFGLLPARSRLAPDSLSSDFQVALAPIDRIEQLDALAALAHDEAGACGNLEFMPLTYTLADRSDYHPPVYASSAQFSELPALLSAVSLPQIRAAIDRMLQLSSRFHSDAIGQTAASTLRELWTAQLKAPSRWTISEVSLAQSPQKSLVARLEGKSSDTVVLGAHLDSIARTGGKLSPFAPGADDDASGLAILTEILRLIEGQQLNFERSIELHAYAAEEVGLIGSRELALSYRAADKVVSGMLQFDMAFYSEGEANGRIYLLEDYTSRDLRRNAMDWIRRYIGPYYTLGRLPAGSASDHKSWWEQGYPTLFPFEDPSHHNPHIHTEQDQTQAFDNGLLIQRMTQLGLLFLSYHAGNSALALSYQQQEPNLLPRDLPRDLYLATDAGEGERLQFWVSAPSAAASLEFCPIEAAASLHCAGERLNLSQASTFGGRRVFSSSSSFDFAKGQRWRITAYDAADEPIAWRQIEFY